MRIGTEPKTKKKKSITIKMKLRVASFHLYFLWFVLYNSKFGDINQCDFIF